jgi:predicted RNA-binding protein with TRAM domain
LKIESVGRRGDGIARINNFVIFVPNTTEGEQVKIRITGVRNSFATGEVVGRSGAGGETTEAGSREETGESEESSSVTGEEESDENF